MRDFYCLGKSTIVAKQSMQHLMLEFCVSSRKLPCWIAYLWLCWSNHTFTHRHASIYGLWSHTFRLCMNIIQPVSFLAIFFDNSYKIALNATPCISSHKKSCNFLMVCWLMSSHQFWQFKPFQQSFKDLNEIKSYDCQSQDPLILVLSDTLKFIDFIGVDRFDSIVISYLVNL